MKDKSFAKFIILLLISIVMSGCAINTSRMMDFTAGDDTMKVLAKSSATRPAWIDALPEDQKDIHFLVGLSNFHATERDAREDAMRHARLEFAQYTGVEVSDVDKLLQALYGLSSSVFDATVSEIGQSHQSVEAHVSRIKAKQWYWEKYRGKNTGSDNIIYKYWVLVTIPANEYERVQAWKAQRQAESLAEKQEQQTQASNYFSSLLQSHQENLIAIDGLIERNEPLNALRAAQAEWNRLYHQAQDFENLGDYFLQYLPQLKQTQQTTLNRIADIRNMIILDHGRNNQRYLSQAQAWVPAWIWSKHSNRYNPIAEIPLLLLNSNGEILAKALSDKNGKAQFFAENLIPGNYVIAIDSDAINFQGLDAVLKDSLASITTSVDFVFPTNPADRSVKLAVQELFDEPAIGQHKVNRLQFDGIKRKSSQLSSTTFVLLEKQLQETLLDIPELELIQHNTSGANTSDALLAVNYIDEYATSILTLELLHPESRNILAVSHASIKNNVAANNKINPTNNIDPIAQEANKNEIVMEITTHMGDAQTFTEGDLVSYYLSFNQDAHLLVIYQDAGGNLIQILPNDAIGNKLFSAQDFFEIPGNNADFELRISAPFGQETIWAFAASAAFPPLKGKALTNGLWLLDEKNMDTVVRELRKLAASAHLAYGETSTRITTVARDNRNFSYAADL